MLQVSRARDGESETSVWRGTTALAGTCLLAAEPVCPRRDGERKEGRTASDLERESEKERERKKGREEARGGEPDKELAGSRSDGVCVCVCVFV